MNMILLSVFVDTLYKISLISDDDRKSTGSDEKTDERKSSWNMKNSERSKSFTESIFSSADTPKGSICDHKERELRNQIPEEISIMVSTCGV